MILKNPILFLFVFVALVSVACSLTIDLPGREITTGQTKTEDIFVPVPDGSSDQVNLSLSFGAGELLLEPGGQDALVDGTATYNVVALTPEIQVNGSTVVIETGQLEINTFPRFNSDLVNRWDLRLGVQPMDLNIMAGAYKGQFEFGGLALKSLRISDGAADVDLSFNKPNLVAMDTLRYDTGASSVTLLGLSNAHFERMRFKGGAGSYMLDFSGELQQDADVTIDAGLSNVQIIIPRNVSARVFVDRGLANVDISDDWEKIGDDYILEGTGPRITINVNIGAGSLELRN
jgi:hypothetical protein